MFVKHLGYCLLAAAVAAAAAGCTRQSGADDPVGPSRLTARIEADSPLTKTAYDDEGPVGEFSWSEGDQIAVHYSDGSYPALSVDHETGAVNAPSTAARMRDCYAVYPAEAAVAANYGNPTLQVRLPASYQLSGIVSGTDTRGWNWSACPMVAVNDPYSDLLYFRHVGSLLRLNVIGVDPAIFRIDVTLDALDELAGHRGNIHGNFTVSNPSGRTPTIERSEGDRHTVSFQLAPDGGSIGSGVKRLVLNLPVPTGTYAGLRVTSFDAAGQTLATLFLDRRFPFQRHYGKRVWVLFPEDLIIEGEDIYWSDNLNEGEDVDWNDGIVNQGENVRWK